MGSHHGPVTGVIAVASRGSDASWMAVSASPDGLLRLWDVESADLVGAVAVPAGAEAMASGGGRIVGRLSNGELWVLAAGSAPRHRGPAQAR